MLAVTFVTGATGFLGEHLVRVLCARGRRVVALSRPTADRTALADLAEPALTWYEGDVCDPEGVAAAVACARELAGDAPVEAVHSAAVVSYRAADRERMRAVNVEGTWNVLAACRRADVARVVHVSSVVAVGPARRGEVLAEEAPFEPRGLSVAYVTTKRAAEEIALGMVGELDVSAVNPGAIFGPARTTPNSARFLVELASGRRVPFAPPGAISVAGVRDVAEGCVLALERGRRGRRYLLTESTWSFRALFALAAAELGARGPLSALPGPLWAALVGGARIVDHFRPLELAPPDSLAMLGRRFTAESRRARDELGWRPAPFREVLLETIADLRARGRIPAAS